MFDPGIQLTDIVDAINAVGATPSDLVAILEALKVSGALARAVDYYLGNTMVDEVRAFVSQSARAELSALERIDRRASLEEVAQQFEAIFVNELMKASRAAKLSDDILSNSGTQPFLEMMDQEFSQTISKRNSLGIAEALVQQFERK